MRPHLLPLTPNASSWDEHGAYHLVAQLESRMKKQPLIVGEKRSLLPVKSATGTKRNPKARMENQPQFNIQPHLAKDIHLQLEERGLDGRDLNPTGERLRRGNPLQGIGFAVKTTLMVMLLPAFLLALATDGSWSIFR